MRLLLTLHYYYVIAIDHGVVLTIVKELKLRTFNKISCLRNSNFNSDQQDFQHRPGLFKFSSF